MKNILFILLVALVFVSCKSRSTETDENKQKQQEIQQSKVAGQLVVSAARPAFPIISIWAKEFQKVYPKSTIKVYTGDDEKNIEVLKERKINMVMASYKPKDSALWTIPVAKDAVVAIFNFDNNSISNLTNDGITKEKLKKIFVSREIDHWGQVYNDKNDEAINVYSLSFKNGASHVWADFLDTEPQNLKGKKMDRDTEIIDAVKKDQNGIGFINLTFAYDNYTKFEHPDFKVLPIDFNANGMIDDAEFFYINKNRLLDAIKDERFHAPPARYIFAVMNNKPKDKLSKAFLKWILTTGKNYMKDAGFVGLESDVANKQLEKLKN